MAAWWFIKLQFLVKEAFRDFVEFFDSFERLFSQNDLMFSFDNSDLKKR